MQMITAMLKPVSELVPGDKILDCFEQVFTVRTLDYVHSGLFDLNVKLVKSKKPDVWFQLHGNKQMKVLVE